jgi:SAM-dependent methyltransferase
MYNEFASVYDRLMHDVDYKKITDRIVELLNVNSAEPMTVLDLGCGTGNVTTELLERGYDCIALDSSTEMLSILNEKCSAKGFDPLIINSDICSFELYGTVDAVVSMTDTLNYLDSKDRIADTFALVHNYLNPSGIFIFDINSIYKFENVFAKNVFFEIDDDISYILESDYDSNKRCAKFDITIFQRDDSISGREMYKRFDELQCEFAYTTDEIKDLLVKTGFVDIKIFDDDPDSERILFACAK